MAKDLKKENQVSTNKNGNSPYFNLEAEKAFFEEVDEEVRNEKFKQLINKYGGIILFILIVALSVAVGYEKIGAWRVHKAEQRNVQYAQAIAPNPDYEVNISELENIVATEEGIYRDIAQLQIANILLDNNQKEKALEALEQLYNSTETVDKIKEIAAIKLATYKIDTAPYSQVALLLSPIAESDKSAWKPMAKELLAMSALQNKDYITAKNIYQELSANSDLSDEFKSRINDMLALINDAQNDAQ